MSNNLGDTGSADIYYLRSTERWSLITRPCRAARAVLSQDVKNEEAVQGVWGQSPPAGSRGGAPVAPRS